MPLVVTRPALSLISHRSLKHWSEAHIKRLRDIQRAGILAAFDFLKPGGTLVYSTCTFAPEENEGVVHNL
jgi:16S rRNA C967 or C1407 C5-methylase (RsmB/RsmF family)